MTRKSENTELVLARLKDFQRRTAEYVFRRFYLDPTTTDRFLVADEVGLGKTLVARGIIALAIEHLRREVDRIDIVYICSNVSIASQNIHRLNVTGVQEFVRPTRLSLLPMHIAGIRKNHVNYVSLTPGTSFDPKSREGKDEERALIHLLLKGKLGVSPAGLRRLLQCRVSDDNWWWWTHEWRPEALDNDICEAFVKNVVEDQELHQRIADFCAMSKRRVLWDHPERLELVSELRIRLAEMSVEMLEPDLIILDEFQRFKNLLDHTNPEARLAQKLFRYEQVKTLLLSATPYKMLSLDHEQDDDHYPDFLNTLRFLFDSESVIGDLKREIQTFRQSLYMLGTDNGSAVSSARDALQSTLCRVMCRTERVGMTHSLDAMLTESRDRPTLQPCDLHEAVMADRVASSVGARDIIEYWKSSPYLINFLRRYEFRRKLEAQCDDPSDELIAALSADESRLLQKATIQSYQEVSPSNPRMRELFSLTIDRGLWKILWMPPSMPYSKPDGPYADVNEVTKNLVFSAWNVVPDAIASLCSYEAERRMISGFSKQISHNQLYEELRPLLRYSRSAEGRLTGMSVLILLYPSPTLADLVDPLNLSMAHHGEGPIPPDVMVERAGEVLKPLLLRLIEGTTDSGPEDQRWYWAAPALMDGHRFPSLKTWLVDDYKGWPSVSADGHTERGERFKEHLELFHQVMGQDIETPLGRPPADLIKILSMMAVAAPGVCALRALRRQSPSLDWDSDALLYGAVRISEGFRTLFNLPESIALLRGDEPETFYWQLALRHCLEGNIQSLLDEQSHCLIESLGVIDESESERAIAIGDCIGSSLSVRTSQLQMDEVRVDPENRKVELEGYNTRCRFALRFAELKDERGATVARADTVREAFNSPFRPFVLASTSIGQEGLDFHTWCHSVIHWNLPNNPVDLEQREGRIHRYKGHAVRKNIALAYGLNALRERWDQQGDPWRFMFELAKIDRPAEANDLIPYWLYEVEGGARIERRVPILAYSKDEPHFHRLKKMLAVYRMVFGQPRQEDLLEYLADRVGEEQQGGCSLDMWRVALEPPR